MRAEKVLRKHVAIIHAYSLMSALQRKIFNVLLYEALNSQNYCGHENSVAVECRISLSNLSKAVNFNSNNIQYLKEAIDGLASLKIEWNILKDKVPGGISFLNLRVLHGSPTFYKDKTFNFSFHKVMLDLGMNPSIYGTVDLDLQSEFESKYGHSLYENSTRFVNLQKNKIIQVDTFRKLLGVDAGKYSSMREFTRNVVMPAVEEVNDRADFIVTLQNVNVGRKITGYELGVENKKQLAQSPPQLYKAPSQKLYEEIQMNFGDLSKATMEDIFQKYTEEYVLEKIEYTKKFAKKDLNGFYPVPYFISALKKDYKLIQQTQDRKECTDIRAEWIEKEKHLKQDISHWKNMLEMRRTNSFASDQIEAFENIIAKAEAALKEHHRNMPELEKV